MAPTKSSKTKQKAPHGWFLAGTHPDEYDANLDTTVFHSGTRSCRVQSNVKKASGWTTLMQNMGPAPYLEKRLRMSFWVKTEDVEYVSGWLRVDGSGKNSMLAFDNMCNRKLEGSHEWIKQQIVLDIPEETTNIGFGVIFSGTGKMWLDDLSFEVVDTSVPQTLCPCHTAPKRDKAAINLDFESAEN